MNYQGSCKRQGSLSRHLRAEVKRPQLHQVTPSWAWSKRVKDVTMRRSWRRRWTPQRSSAQTRRSDIHRSWVWMDMNGINPRKHLSALEGREKPGSKKGIKALALGTFGMFCWESWGCLCPEHFDIIFRRSCWWATWVASWQFWQWCRKPWRERCQQRHGPQRRVVWACDGQPGTCGSKQHLSTMMLCRCWMRLVAKVVVRTWD